MYFRNIEVDVKELDAERERFLRSNRGGDDLATRLVFVVIVVAVAAWLIRLWIVGHGH